MKYLLTFFTLIFLIACDSDDSDSDAKVVNKKGPRAPTALTLETPAASPGIDPTPTIKVSGVVEGASVTLFFDSSCKTKASAEVKVEKGESEVSITSKNLGDEDVEVTFYAAGRDGAGNKSPCSKASLSYVLDLTAPAAPTGLSLSDPATSPGKYATPLILVEGVEKGAKVTLYRDSSCDHAISQVQTVSAGQTSIAINSDHLGSSDITVDYYSAQRDIFDRSSECSTASVSYGFIYTPPVTISEINLEVGSYFHDDPSSDTLEISVTFSENVNVTGTPRLELTLGEATRYALYTSGSSSSTLIFSYDISSDDYDSDGIEMATLIDLNGGSIKGSTSSNIILSSTLPDNMDRVWINFEEKVFPTPGSNSGAFAFLKKGGSVVTWGDSYYGGNSSSVSSDLSEGVVNIFSNGGVFAALKKDGSVITWGHASYGADAGNATPDLQRGVKKIFSLTYDDGSAGAFAALKEDGSVVTWGSSRYGGNSLSVSSDLRGNVVEIFSTDYAFAALKENGSVVTWGGSSWGGNSSGVSSDLKRGVKKIFSTVYAFAALKENGSVVTWGYSPWGANSNHVSPDLQEGVVDIRSTWGAFAALKENGSVITWGHGSAGGNSSSVSPDLQGGVSKIFSASGGAFAALKGEDGPVVTWGNGGRGGSLGNASSDLQRGVVEIFSASRAFAALKDDGSVITWGSAGEGGNSLSVSSDLREDVVEIFSSFAAFAALKENGSVITWGHLSYGGDSNDVSSDLQSGVIEIFSTNSAFAALKEDGSVITWGASSYGGDSSGVDLGPRW